MKLLTTVKSAKDSDFKDGYITAINEALEIVQEHEDESE